MVDENNEVNEADYIANIDQSQGVFEPEHFQHPYTKQMTEDAKSVTKQVVDLWNKGDEETRAAMRQFEIELNGGAYTTTPQGRAMLEKSLSLNKLDPSTIWELFYGAHQKYIGSRLGDEDNGPEFGSEEYRYLSGWYQFDWQNRPQFDYGRIRNKITIPNIK